MRNTRLRPELTVKVNPWDKSLQEIVAMLALRNARAAQAGRACPVAARVLGRLSKVKED